MTHIVCVHQNCDKRFKRKNSSINHIARVHQKQKSHKCFLKNTSWRAKMQLTKHPFKSSQCGEWFSQKGNLMKHMAMCTNARRVTRVSHGKATYWGTLQVCTTSKEQSSAYNVTRGYHKKATWWNTWQCAPKAEVPQVLDRGFARISRSPTGAPSVTKARTTNTCNRDEIHCRCAPKAGAS